MKNSLTFSNIINILIDNKKNTYPQYLLVADLFGLNLGIDFYVGETPGVADSNTISISNWCTGKRPIPLDIVQENDADNFTSMTERFAEKICPNILNISHARTETEKLLQENEAILGQEMIEAKEAFKMLSKEPVLFVSGIAGIGKSEFAKYYAEKYIKKYANTIYWFYI